MMNMENYKHKIQYYETDKMGITHHSNYVRIMEETRVDMMEKLGYGYDRMEAEGIISPVMSVSLDYRKPTTYPDIVEVELSVLEMSRFKVKFAYKMTVGDTLVCSATSTHCFLNKQGRPVTLQESCPDLYEAFSALRQEVDNDKN